MNVSQNHSYLVCSVFLYCPLPCNGVQLQSAKLILKINVRSSTTVRVEIVLTNSKRNTGAKICLIHILHSQKKPITTPPCLIHNPLHTPHSPQVSQSSFLNSSRTPVHSIDQVLWQDLASPVVSPPTNVLSLEQPCDPARSRPIGLPKKKFVSTPWTNRAFQCGFLPFFIYIFCGVGCLSQGKEGQREKN